MVYKPNQYGEFERSRAHAVLWWGLPAALLLLTGHLFGAPNIATATGAGFAGGTLLFMCFRQADEVIEQQMLFAGRWTLSFVGLLVIVTSFPFIGEFELDTPLCLALTTVIFHAALTWRRLQDRAFGGDEE